MTKLPNKVRILRGITYRVERVGVIDGNPLFLGMCIKEDRLIQIKKKLSKKMTFVTYIHEVIEAIKMESLGLKGLPHKYIEALDVGLYNVIKLNGYL